MMWRTCSIAQKAKKIAAKRARKPAASFATPLIPAIARIAAREASALKLACMPTATM